MTAVINTVEIVTALPGYARSYATYTGQTPGVSSLGFIGLASAPIATLTIGGFNSSPNKVASFSAGVTDTLVTTSRDIAALSNGTYYVYWGIAALPLVDFPGTPLTLFGTTVYTESSGTTLGTQSNLEQGTSVYTDEVVLSLPDGVEAFASASMFSTARQMADSTTTINLTTQALISINGSPPARSGQVNNTDRIRWVIPSVYGSTYSVGLDLAVNNVYDSFYSKTINARVEPDSVRVNFNRATFAIRKENVLVISRTDQTNSVALASYYQSARNIPQRNMLSITPTFGMVRSITVAQLRDFLSKVVVGLETIHTPITTILLCGDFPSTISNWPPGVGTPQTEMNFPLAMKHPAYWLTKIPTTDYVANDLVLATGFWDDNAEFRCPSLKNNGIKLDPCFTPTITETDSYSLFTLPISPLVNGFEIAKQRILDAIAAEKCGYQDWGTVLAYSGTTLNPISRCIIEEARWLLGQQIPANLYWANLQDEYNENVIAANDPSGWATYQPGDASFPTGTSKPKNVFLRSPGVKGYYELTHTAIEQVGDFNYRLGAICIFSQSFGYDPTGATTTVSAVSRALASFRAGATISAGVCCEPTAFGDLDCLGLFSTLWFGGNMAEWAHRIYAGYTYTPFPFGWYILGDPLYAPFRQGRVPGAFKLFG